MQQRKIEMEFVREDACNYYLCDTTGMQLVTTDARLSPQIKRRDSFVTKVLLPVITVAEKKPFCFPEGHGSNKVR